MDCLKNGERERMWFGTGVEVHVVRTDRGVSWVVTYKCTYMYVYANFGLYPPCRYTHNVRVRMLRVVCVAKSQVQVYLSSSAAAQYMSNNILKQ